MDMRHLNVDCVLKGSRLHKVFGSMFGVILERSLLTVQSVLKLLVVKNGQRTTFAASIRVKTPISVERIERSMDTDRVSRHIKGTAINGNHLDYMTMLSHHLSWF